MDTIAPRPKHPLIAIWHFVCHTLIGICLFALVAGSALGIHFIAEYVAYLGAPAEIFLVIKFLEYCVLAIDAFLFLVFMAIVAMAATGDLPLSISSTED